MLPLGISYYFIHSVPHHSILQNSPFLSYSFSVIYFFSFWIFFIQVPFYFILNHSSQPFWLYFAMWSSFGVSESWVGKFDIKKEEGMFYLAHEQTGTEIASKFLRPQGKGRNCSKTNPGIQSGSHETDCDFIAEKLNGHLLFKSPLTKALKMMLLLSTLVLRGSTEQPPSITHPAYLESSLCC